MHSPYEDEVNLRQVFMQAKMPVFFDFGSVSWRTAMTMFSKTFHLVRSVLLWACVALFAASACDAHMTIGENTLVARFNQFERIW